MTFSIIAQYNATVVEVTAPNQISILLQVPMYIVMTASEVLVSISAVEFAYSQAPASMKAICQTTWLWTTAFGNIIVIIMAELNLFANQVSVMYIPLQKLNCSLTIFLCYMKYNA